MKIRRAIFFALALNLIFHPAFALGDESFLWGAATSAHQIEGGEVQTDWLEFEKEGRAKNGDTAEIACDGYNLAFSDISLLKQLNVNAYRFSIEWARVEPEKGKFDGAALAHYKRLIQELRANNITPVVTLHHFTNPLWVSDSGGWLNKENSVSFNKYVQKVIDQNPEVEYFVTFNEPSVFLAFSYLYKFFPPYKRSPLSYYKAFQNVLRSHKFAYDYIHGKNPSAKVGLAYSFTDFTSKGNNKADDFFTKFGEYSFSWFWLDQLKGQMDYIGINYYRRYYLGLGYPYVERSDSLGQTIGFERVIEKSWNRYKKPILITENGIATDNDEKRVAFLNDQVQAIKNLKQKRIPIDGYFYWTLIDDFEFFAGYELKWGLYAVDKETMERIPKPSANFFSSLKGEVN
ncbi:MAG: family 1 glycosylhydrolase [Patescibacteria group bacterium]|nr:family 1 glycosylhydrolase [Patescibacteria group bacterium]